MKTNTIVSRKELIADLRRVKKDIGKKRLTRTIYRDLGKHASSTVEERLSGWNRAKRTAGVAGAR